MAWLLRSAFALSRGLGPSRSSAFGGFITRSFGPLLPQHRIALQNVRLAFPAKSEAEVKRIVSAAWENLGRNAAEYAHLAEMVDCDENGDGRHTQVVGIENIRAMRDDRKPG